MLNRYLLTLAFVVASPAMLFSQDIFLSFDQGPIFQANEVVPDSAIGTSGSAFVFSDNGFDLGALEIDFAVDDTSVVQLTGATIFNPGIGFVGMTRWDQIRDLTSGTPPIDESVAELDAGSVSSGRLLGTSFFRDLSDGINSLNAPFDPFFNVEADAFLVGQIDFDIVGSGTTNFTLAGASPTAFADRNANVLNPVIAGGTFTVETIPEPSSGTLLALGLFGLVARRRRRECRLTNKP